MSVDELASETGWGEVDARIRGRKAIGVTTSGVRELSLTPGDAQVDRRADVQVTIDGQVVTFAPEEPLVLRKEGTWTKGRRPAGERVKRGTITGPIRDVFYEPLMFVYADDPEEARAAEQVARSLARIRGGVRVAYPVLSDGEFFGREPLGNDKALVLVGRTNCVAAALAKAHPQDFPIRVDAGGVTMGGERFTGREVGAAYVRRTRRNRRAMCRRRRRGRRASFARPRCPILARLRGVGRRRRACTRPGHPGLGLPRGASFDGLVAPRAAVDLTRRF